jgi:hypothetical protein
LSVIRYFLFVIRFECCRLPGSKLATPFLMLHAKP